MRNIDIDIDIDIDVLRSFAKEGNVLTFFYVLCKRMLRSFTFFAKERCVLCKRMLRSLRSFLFFRKERERTERSCLNEN